MLQFTEPAMIWRHIKIVWTDSVQLVIRRSKKYPQFISYKYNLLWSRKFRKKGLN